MSTAEKIYELVQDLPAFRQIEVLDFAYYIAQRDSPSVNDKFSFTQFAGALKESKTFAGDPVKIQEKLRDEWH